MPITHAAHADPITATDYEAGHVALRYDPDDTATTTVDVGHEFTDGTHNSFAWAPSAPGTNDVTTYNGYLRTISSDATVRYYSKAWTPGATDATAVIGFEWAHRTNLAHLAIMFGDATGVLEGAGGNATMAQLNFGMTSNATFDCYDLNTGSFSQVGATQQVGSILGSGRAYLRITRTVSGPTWRYYYSEDGRSWLELNTTGTKSLTIGAIAVRLAADSGTTNPADVSIRFIRGWDAVIEKIGS